MLLLVALLSSLLPQVASECTQFLTNGSAAAKYEFYRFYDFRNLHDSSNASSTSAYAASNDRSRILSTAPWTSGWTAKNWLRPSVKKDTIDMKYSPSELSIINDTDSYNKHPTYLTLHTTRLINGTQLAAELDYTEYNVTYASMRMSARARGASGAVAAFFIYHNDTTESDIEIMTRDSSSQVHYSNQPTTDPDTDAPILGATYNTSLAAQRSTSVWNVYRLDWIARRSVWYVNGEQTASTQVNVPSTESMIILNMWSNGGNFSGRMQTGGEAWFDIQWVELLFNTTTSANSKGGGTVCSAEHSPGSPVPGIGSPQYGSIMAGTFWWSVGIVSAATLSNCII